MRSKSRHLFMSGDSFFRKASVSISLSFKLQTQKPVDSNYPASSELLTDPPKKRSRICWAYYSAEPKSNGNSIITLGLTVCAEKKALWTSHQVRKFANYLQFKTGGHYEGRELGPDAAAQNLNHFRFCWVCWTFTFDLSIFSGWEKRAILDVE